MSKPDRLLSMLGLAAKSGNVVSGEFQTETAIKSGKARLVILSEDASDNTKRKFTNMCEYRDIPYREYRDMETLGHAIGKEARSSLALTNDGFADAIRKLFQEQMTQ